VPERDRQARTARHGTAQQLLPARGAARRQGSEAQRRSVRARRDHLAARSQLTKPPWGRGGGRGGADNGSARALGSKARERDGGGACVCVRVRAAGTDPSARGTDPVE
jgi:hypothetical protein